MYRKYIFFPGLLFCALRRMYNNYYVDRIFQRLYDFLKIPFEIPGTVEFF